jgi:hypothetical protein
VLEATLVEAGTTIGSALGPMAGLKLLGSTVFDCTVVVVAKSAATAVSEMVGPMLTRGACIVTVPGVGMPKLY